MKISLWKPVFGLVCAAVITLTVSTTALAQRPGGPRGGGAPDPAKTVAGKLTAIGTATITITTPEQKQEIVGLTAQTVYRRNRAEATLASFVVDDFVKADGARDASGQLVAARVEGGDKLPPGGPGGGKRGPAGEFVSADASSFVVKVRNGNTLTVLVNAQTVIERNRQTATLADYKAGDHIAAEGALNESNQFVARRVRGGDAPPDKDALMANSRVVLGDVVSVDPAGGSITFIGQNGIEQTVQLGATAVIHRNGEPVELKALREGDLIKVAGFLDGTGRLVVTFVKSSGLPELD